MKKAVTLTLTTLAAAAITTVASRNAISAGQGTAIVRLQATTPGSAQTGHSNLTGTIKAGLFQGSGSGITGLSASNISSGTLPDARLSSNVALLSSSNTFSGALNVFNGTLRTTAFALGTSSVAGRIMTTDANGNGTWQDPNLAGIVAGGDLTGTYPNPNLATAATSLAKVSGGLLYTNGTFLGIGTTSQFGAAGLTYKQTTTAYGGIHVMTSSSTGLPFYGYSQNNVATGWTTVDGGDSNKWKLFLNGTPRLTVSNTGLVGIATTTPGYPLSFANLLGDKISLWGQSGDHYGFGVQNSLLQIHSSDSASDIAFGYGSSAALSETVRFKGNGRVGIGAPNPTTKLDVRGDFSITNPFGNQRILSLVDGGDHGLLLTIDSNGWAKVALQTINASPNFGGYMSVCNKSGVPTAGAYVDSTGTGIVFGNVKSFREPNPDDDETDIWYASIEGPEAGAYIRGTATLQNGFAKVELPKHFSAVASEKGLTVQLTPTSADSMGLAVVSKSTAGFEVRELMRGTGNYEFDWRVECVRKGYEDFRVIRPKSEVPTPVSPASKKTP